MPMIQTLPHFETGLAAFLLFCGDPEIEKVYAASSSFAFASVLRVTSLPPSRRASSCRRERLSSGFMCVSVISPSVSFADDKVMMTTARHLRQVSDAHHLSRFTELAQQFTHYPPPSGPLIPTSTSLGKSGRGFHLRAVIT